MAGTNMEKERILCVYCNNPFTKEMMEVYEGSYGCDTGCSTVEVVVTCDNCGKICYEKSNLGSVYEETSEEEWLEIIEQAKENGLEEIKIQS